MKVKITDSKHPGLKIGDVVYMTHFRAYNTWDFHDDNKHITYLDKAYIFTCGTSKMWLASPEEEKEGLWTVEFELASAYSS